jgi:iron complex outermembrane recepter protein
VREFLFTTHKVEVAGPDYRVWAYGAWENAGNSFDSRFAALNMLNLAKTHNAWMVQYVLTYTGQMRRIAQALGLDPDDVGHSHGRGSCERLALLLIRIGQIGSLT